MASAIVALAVCSPGAAAQPPAIDVAIDLPGLSAARTGRVRAAVADGAQLLVEWFPPAPSTFSISPAQVKPRWIEPERGAGIEHAVLRELSRLLWMNEGSADAFRTALAEYSAAMAIHRSLGTRQVHVERFFNDAIPYTVRQLSLTPRGSDIRPRLRYFGPPDSLDAGVDRWLEALTTIERYLGWPALEQALAAVRASGAITPAQLQASLGEQTGRELGWLFAMFDGREVIDYAIVDLTSARSSDGRFETIVTVRRLGPGVMAGTNQPRGNGAAHSLPVLVRFEDGNETRDWIDGRDETTVLRYDSAAPARLASVDPDAFLMLDEDRTNNTRTLGEIGKDPIGVRLALNWMAWLQDAMLAYTALI